MKKLLGIFLLCVLLLVSCGDKKTNDTNKTNDGTEENNTSEFKTDVGVRDIANKFLLIANNPSIGKLDDDTIKFNTSNIIDLDLCEEYTMYTDLTMSTVDQFGIYKASSEENAEKLLSQVKEYVQSMKDNFMSEYEPQEVPKLQNAAVKKNGLYITYVISDDTPQNKILSEFDSLLKN